MNPKTKVIASSSQARKVLLDCGTQHQQGLNAMIEKLGVDESWIVHSFEANPHTYKSQADKRIPWVNYHNLAVSWQDQEVVVHCEELDDGFQGGGSSIMLPDNWRTEKRYGRKLACDDAKVQGFDFSKWIKTMTTTGQWGLPEIYIKMDIEGAEIFVLDKMLADGVIQATLGSGEQPPPKLIKKLFIEFHFDLLVGMDISSQTHRITQYFFRDNTQLEYHN